MIVEYERDRYGSTWRWVCGDSTGLLHWDFNGFGAPLVEFTESDVPDDWEAIEHQVINQFRGD